MGVMQKFVLNPVTPISNISSEAPNANKIASGKNITISQIMQVIPTEKAEAKYKHVQFSAQLIGQPTDISCCTFRKRNHNAPPLLSLLSNSKTFLIVY